jgi:hypothetical protein
MIHVMLPVQYLQRAGERLAEPQKRLMLAVLQTVVYDCQGPEPRAAAAAGYRKGRAHHEARAYVASRDREWPYSFENLCEAIGIDAAYLRRGIERALLLTT